MRLAKCLHGNPQGITSGGEASISLQQTQSFSQALMCSHYIFTRPEKEDLPIFLNTNIIAQMTVCPLLITAVLL